MADKASSHGGWAGLPHLDVRVQASTLTADRPARPDPTEARPSGGPAQGRPGCVRKGQPHGGPVQAQAHAAQVHHAAETRGDGGARERRAPRSTHTAQHSGLTSLLVPALSPEAWLAMLFHTRTCRQRWLPRPSSSVPLSPNRGRRHDTPAVRQRQPHAELLKEGAT